MKKRRAEKITSDSFFYKKANIIFVKSIKSLRKGVQPGSFACGNESGKYAKLQHG